MRVVLVGSDFKTDVAYLELLDDEVDLVVYGHSRQLRGQTAPPTPPPTALATRTLRPVVVTPRGPLVWYFPGLRRALTEDRPDVVHVVGEPWRLTAVQAAAWVRRRPNAALVSQWADRNWMSVPAAERALRRRLARRTLVRANGIAAESRQALGEAERFGLTEGTPSAVINTNPRDSTIFRPPADDEERAAARRALGLHVDGVGVGFIGRLTPEKGPQLFLDAVDRLHSTSRCWTALAGMGPMEAEVRRRAQPPLITHLGRLDFPAQVADFYRAVNVLVVPSLRLGRWDEQGSRAVIEGMLSGCVVVATNVGANPEMIRETGVVVEPEPAALAEGIGRAIHLDGRAGRRRALELYSAEAVAGALVELWREALAIRMAS